MNNTPKYTFYGDQKHRATERHPDAPKKQEPYIATSEDENLVQAVNLAMFLHRPLLLEGEAGCGKTRLAHAVADEVGLPLYRWDIRSTSKAQEGLYHYDALMRLHDVQLSRSESHPKKPTLHDPNHPEHYRQFGAIGKAFQLKDCPAVVLIDEIDKADLDFPNDLLTVLDEPWEFEIPETGETGKNKIKASHPPLVIITSNGEKGNLPVPFLRRCIYSFLKFPKQDDLKKIVKAHYQIDEKPVPEDDLVEAATGRFFAIREKANLRKKPSTSEFLDWLRALSVFTPQPYPSSELEKIALEKMPYLGLLFKIHGDYPQQEA